MADGYILLKFEFKYGVKKTDCNLIKPSPHVARIPEQKCDFAALCLQCRRIVAEVEPLWRVSSWETLVPPVPAQLERTSRLSSTDQRWGWIQDDGWGRSVFLRPSIASHRSTWMCGFAVRPSVIETITLIQMGLHCGLWPRGQGSAQRGQRPVFKESCWSSSFFKKTCGSLIEGPPYKAQVRGPWHQSWPVSSAAGRNRRQLFWRES